MSRITRRLALTGAVVLGLAACGGDDETTRIANPASEFCVEQGGTSVIENTDDGDVGYCEIDGERIDEWEYFRANHESAQLANPAAVYCAEQGGETVGPEPMCILPDGTEVDAWEYFRENN